MLIFRLIAGLMINIAIFGHAALFAGRHVGVVACLGIPGSRFCLLCSDGNQHLSRQGGLA